VTSPPGLLGIDNAGLWSVCYRDVPEHETVSNLTSHLEGIIYENLFGSEKDSSNDMVDKEQLEKEIRSSSFNQTLQERLKEITDPTVNGNGNGTDADQVATVMEGIDEVSPDDIPEDIKNGIMYSDLLKELAVKLLVNESIEKFPISSGCSNSMRLQETDHVGEFFESVPYPTGPSTYYVLQSLRGFVVGFGLFGVLACLLSFVLVGVRVGSCGVSLLVILIVVIVLQVISGMAGIAAYFILLARLSSSDSKQLLNVSYLFVEEPIEYGLHQYWGWSAWVFIGGVCWAFLGFPILFGVLYKHKKLASSDQSYGLLSPRDQHKHVEFVPSTHVDDLSDEENYTEATN